MATCSICLFDDKSVAPVNGVLYCATCRPKPAETLVAENERANISELSEQEKSGLCIELMGWDLEPCVGPGDDCTWYMLVDKWGQSVNEADYLFDNPPNLYDPANMALAWRVLNWAYDTAATTDNQRVEPEDWFFIIGGLMHGIWAQPPAEAMAAWLDQFLELAIEAGIDGGKRAMKLSQAQQRVVDFMKKHDSKVCITRGFNYTHVRFRVDDDCWLARRPSIITINRLIDLGVIVPDNDMTTPYYREDYKLTEVSE